MSILIAQQNGFSTDLKSGNILYIDDTAMFKKGIENGWREEIYIVAAIMGKMVGYKTKHLSTAPKWRCKFIYLSWLIITAATKKDDWTGVWLRCTFNRLVVAEFLL